MTEALRIGLFLHTLDDRAVSRLNLRLAREFAARGRAVELICATRSPSARVPERLPVNDLHLGTKTTSRGIARLAGVLRAQRFDVLFSHGNGPNRAAVLARSFGRVPTKVVLVEQQHYTTAGWDRRRARDLAVRLIYPRADVVAGPAPGVVEDLQRVAPGIAGKTAVLVNPGVDPQAVERARTTDPGHPWLDQDRDHKVIVSVANVIPRKGQDVILEALPAIRAVAGDVRAVLIGRHDNPDYLARLHALIRERGLSDVVDLPGYRADPLPAMTATDVFVLASRNEGMPLVLVEAMACGTPVVATDCPSGPEFLLGSGNGVLVPVDDHEALARAVASVLTDDGVRERLVTNGRERAAGFTPTAVATAYLALADRLAADRRTRRQA